MGTPGSGATSRYSRSRGAWHGTGWHANGSMHGMARARWEVAAWAVSSTIGNSAASTGASLFNQLTVTSSRY